MSLKCEEVHEESFVHVVVQQFVLKGGHTNTFHLTFARVSVPLLRILLDAVHQLSERIEIFRVSSQCWVKVFLKRYRRCSLPCVGVVNRKPSYTTQKLRVNFTIGNRLPGLLISQISRV